MTWSKPGLPLGLTYLSRSDLSAAGEPVNRPVLIECFCCTVWARAAPAASHDPSSVRASAHLQPALGFFALAGITNDEPVATVTGLPSLPLNGTAASFSVLWYGDSTLGYHCASTSAPTWFLTNWFLSPNTSNASVKLLYLAKPPWASVIFLSSSSP